MYWKSLTASIVFHGELIKPGIGYPKNNRTYAPSAIWGYPPPGRELLVKVCVPTLLVVGRLPTTPAKKLPTSPDFSKETGETEPVVLSPKHYSLDND